MTLLKVKDDDGNDIEITQTFTVSAPEDKPNDNDDLSNGASSVTNYTIQVYREYNPNAKEAGAHNYTTSENENDTLVAIGWLDEGIGWWALK
ncbi:MAG: hypothetical protein K2H85_01405 [Allobaculum sp.]|nr:hypothetical protein [Allobaculum sp.]